MDTPDAVIQVEAAEWQDVLADLRDEYGPGATGELARRTGAAPRTVRRWLNVGGRVGAKWRAAADRVRAQASRDRKAKAIEDGALRSSALVVQVVSDSDGKSAGSRTIGEQDLTPIAGRVAQLIRAGRDRDAAQLIEAGILAGYAGESVADAKAGEGLAGILSISWASSSGTIDY
jgi:hypothetical protein